MTKAPKAAKLVASWCVVTGTSGLAGSSCGPHPGGSLTWKTAGVYSSSMELCSRTDGQSGPRPRVTSSSPNRERFPRGAAPTRDTSSWQESAECRRRGAWAGRPEPGKACTWRGEAREAGACLQALPTLTNQLSGLL